MSTRSNPDQAAVQRAFVEHETTIRQLEAENEALREDMLRLRTAALMNTPFSVKEFALQITRKWCSPSSDEQEVCDA